MHTPWTNLPVNKVKAFGIKTSIPAIKASELANIKFLFRDSFFKKIWERKAPMHAPKAGIPEYTPLAVYRGNTIL